MPPKKRTAPVIDPGPNKRATRSSTKASAAEAEPTKTFKEGAKDTEAPKSKASTSRKSKTSKSTPKPTSESSATKETSTSDDPKKDTRTNVESLTIDSDLTKKPIACELYNAPTSSSQPTMIFTHGAGGTLSAPAVVNFCTGFSQSRSVLAFQGSMNLASRVKGFHACVEHLGKESGGGALVLGGRSMGARAAVMAATERLEEDRNAEVQIVLVSFPLKGPKDDLRDEILLALPGNVRVLFVIGDRDAMCPLDTLNEVRMKMKAKSQLVVVKGADHGMHVKPAGMETQLGEETGTMASRWLEGDMSESVVYIGT